MNSITRTLFDRVTCVQRRQLVCLHPDHQHDTPCIEVLEFVLDGAVNVWIERAEGNTYHVKVGEYSNLFQSERQVIKLLEAQ